MTKLDDTTIDYIEELSLTMKTLSLQIEAIESDLKKVKKTLTTLSSLKWNITSLEDIIQANKKTHKALQKASEENVVEWEFDGYFMVGDDTKKYPVPINYASKSKLIPGDRLKLKIKNNGELIYKLIQAAERQHIRAVLSKDKKDNNKYIAIGSDKKTYSLNSAAVSYYKWLPWDEAYITINKDGKWHYAALDAIIKTDI